MISLSSEVDGVSSRRHLGARLLEKPPSGSHIVQFYEDDAFLFESVGRFLATGALAGDRLLVIATPAHSAGICAALRLALGGSLPDDQLTLIDAEALLSEFMRGGMPDATLFGKVLDRIVAATRPRPGSRLRAFGEMVNVLCEQGQMRGAIRLEELWNEAGSEHEFSLLCAYTLRHFDRKDDAHGFLGVCGCHSHVLPTESFARIENLDAALRQVSLLEQRSRLLESEIESRKEIERALRDALDQGERGRAALAASLQREERARRTAEQSDAFKEVFVDILGHELRNPLNTILTTTRLMAMRGELGQDTTTRLDRVITSGVRLQRMVEQMLDMTRDRLAGGIPLHREPHDLAPLVKKVAEGLRVAHPARDVQLNAQSCVARVDAERFVQVASNFVDNAATHGNPELPIFVTLAQRGSFVTLGVSSHGPAIEPELLSTLFDPFHRPRKPVGRSAGLGLGLYLSARIVEAHGGEIHVESSEESGTLFAASFPLDL